MLLSQIAAHVGLTGTHPDVEITGIALSSALTGPGYLFIALPGAHTHGARYVEEARSKGAVAVLTDPEGAQLVGSLPTLVVPDLRSHIGALASFFFAEPSHQLSVMGITGTNGKTTTAFMMEAAARAAGATTGLLGTVETRIAGSIFKSERTTPEAPQLQQLLAQMVDHQVTHVAMEVSSHALALGRVSGVHFAVVGFTNLSQDHLDFHGDMESYYQAKASLFTSQFADNAVINIDDAYGRRLLEDVSIPALALSSRGQADWYASNVLTHARGSSAQITDPYGRSYDLALAIPGRYNVDNALMAIAMVSATGADTAAAVRGVAALTGVPGRMERVDTGETCTVIVDYAHTPDAVASLLKEVRATTTGRIIGVLGCGGDRDASKRPLMGRALAQGCDVAILTSDNPRSEDPIAILQAMEDGAREVSGATVMVEADRHTAIEQAIALAQLDDCVVIAGKGHELGQEIQGKVTPFDDRAVARDVLRKWQP